MTLTDEHYAPAMSDRLSRAEAADVLGVTPSTVDRYALAGRLTRSKNKVTLRVTFDAREVEELRRVREEEGEDG